jgi:8-oxo-dGTP pyrophosphatase MutT (NUDIX family)
LRDAAGIPKSVPSIHGRDQNHFDAMSVQLMEHCDEGIVSISAAAIGESNVELGGMPTGESRLVYATVSMGRSKHCPTLQAETSEATRNAKSSSKKQYVNLAVVGMVFDAAGDHLLITRRPSYMRSFPRAYVFPGGGVNAGESLLDAVAREVREETGLSVREWTLESLWESVYPTVSEPGVPIQAHHLVCYFSGRLNERLDNSIADQLVLCEEEVDGALWLSRKDIDSILNSTEKSDDGERNRELRFCTNNSEDNPSVKLKDLIGIYPQINESGEYCGIAQGSLFALEEFSLKG